jgi:hypothetical protein
LRVLLRFPDHVYEHIGKFYEHKAEQEEARDKA